MMQTLKNIIETNFFHLIKNFYRVTLLTYLAVNMGQLLLGSGQQESLLLPLQHF